jgi:hypothetical protein
MSDNTAIAVCRGRTWFNAFLRHFLQSPNIEIEPWGASIKITILRDGAEAGTRRGGVDG